MKKILVLAAMISGIIFSGKANAQVSVNINVGAQPLWGPAGYDHVDYYYLPDIDVYYNVAQRQYIYADRGRWMFASALPARYRNYDIYKSYKVVVNEPKPYLHADVYRTKYSRYKGWNNKQVIIRDSHDKRYMSSQQNMARNDHNNRKEPKRH